MDTLEIVILVWGTDLMMFPHNYTVDIVVKDWYKFEDLFYKLFLIMCYGGQQRLVKFHVYIRRTSLNAGVGLGGLKQNADSADSGNWRSN